MTEADDGTTALQDLESICGEIYGRWDKDQRSGKLLAALAGSLSGYSPRVDRVRGALEHDAAAAIARESADAEIARLQEALQYGFDLYGPNAPDGPWPFVRRNEFNRLAIAALNNGARHD